MPVTVRLIDLAAEAATVSCAWSCRCADWGSTAPRSQDAVPSAWPQPKLNLGVPALSGVACTWTATAGTVAPVVQVLTVQRACWPRALLACVAVTATQRLAGEGGSAGGAGPVAVVVGPAVVGRGSVGVGLAVDGVAEGLADAVGAAVLDGLAVAEVFVLCDGVRSGAVLGVAVGVGLAVVGVGLAVVGVGLAVVGVGLAVVGVGVAGGLDGGAGSRSGSHD
jgi:hypothetical protein